MHFFRVLSDDSVSVKPRRSGVKPIYSDIWLLEGGAEQRCQTLLHVTLLRVTLLCVMRGAVTGGNVAARIVCCGANNQYGAGIAYDSIILPVRGDRRTSAI